MPLTNFPNGVSSFGIPVVGAGPLSIPTQYGTVWFVDTTLGSDGNQGTDPTQPLKTIAQALTKAGDGTGDTIYVMPGTYDENLTVDKDYIAIIGAQYAGYAKPDITPSTGIAMTVTGQGFMSRHCRYASDDDDTVVQKGNGFLYSDCVLDGNATATKGGIRLLPDDNDNSLTASEGEIVGCYIRGNAIGIIFDTGAPPTSGVGSTDNFIHDNRFSANTIDLATADSGAGAVYSVQTTIIGPGNQFEDKNKACYIDLTTTNGGAAGDQNGAINGNYFAADAITAGNEVKMVGTGFTFTGNYITTGIKDGSGLD